MNAFTPDRIARFWSRVRKTDRCWEWTGLRFADSMRYGRFSFNGGSLRVHRLSWILAHGPIPDGLFVLHRCDNPICVWPDHLFLGTQAENIRDCVSKGRNAIGDRNGSRLNRGRHRGTLNPSAKLTEPDVTAIRRLVGHGQITRADIGRLYAVTGQTVTSIARRRLWVHVG